MSQYTAKSPDELTVVVGHFGDGKRSLAVFAAGAAKPDVYFVEKNLEKLVRRATCKGRAPQHPFVLKVLEAVWKQDQSLLEFPAQRYTMLSL